MGVPKHMPRVLAKLKEIGTYITKCGCGSDAQPIHVKRSSKLEAVLNNPFSPLSVGLKQSSSKGNMTSDVCGLDPDFELAPHHPFVTEGNAHAIVALSTEMQRTDSGRVQNVRMRSRVQQLLHAINHAVLCGLEPNHPFEALVLDEEDRTMVDGLLQAVIGNWTAIGNTFSR